MAAKITMADIARMAGVTKSTVSRYFNGGSVKESTRDRIQEIIEQYNYEPNTFARLKARESNVIGVVVPTLNSKVTSRVITSIGRYLRDQGYETLIKDSDHSIELELRNIQRLMAQNVDGILLSAITITEEHRQLLGECPIPVVVLAQEYEEGISVLQDDYGAGVAMGRLVGESCRKRAEASGRQQAQVAYLGVEESDVAVGIRRRQGVEEGLRQKGITDVSFCKGDYSYESGQQMARKALEKGVPDAMICATDRLAFGAYRVLGEKGIGIPDLVAVAGFGGYDESELLTPALTTLRFDSYALGYLGAETVLKLIREEPVPKKQIVDFQLVPGKSVTQ
ncbi:MAG: LacI family DNA-binding transcriptional regulator [Clostridiales bacterium]|nr:LacI family DNA-binding transcriptional regulator [Clostridiales bacterium]